jgi:hypothetical protein
VLAALILLPCVLVGATQVLISDVGRNFITSLTQRSSATFYHNLWVYLAAFAVAIPSGSFIGTPPSAFPFYGGNG